MMEDVEMIEEAVIDLGPASSETKGNAIFRSDGSGGELLSIAGIADD
jgi:hypothetical protein